MTHAWRIAARFDNVAPARREISEIVAECGAVEDDVALVELAAGELVANAMEHGNGEFVEIAINVLCASAVITVTNEGPGFERPHVDLPGMGFEESGRGLAILAAFGCGLAIERPNTGACKVTATIPFQGACSNDLVR